MRNILWTICSALFLVACDGGGTSEAIRYPEESSEALSSAIELSAESSSEVISSIIESSSSDKSSSSEALLNSSSSVGVFPCKTEREDNCEYGTLVDERDGQTYKTVKIGKQWWMAENLNYAYLQPTSTQDSSSWCYNDSAEYCDKYGRLYLWSAAMDSAALFSDGTKGCGYFPNSKDSFQCPNDLDVLGICPEGWHLPSLKEYRILIRNVKDVHLLLSVAGEWYEGQSNTDEFGFDLLPGGYYCSTYDSYGPSFDFIYEVAFLWLATENGSKSAWHLYGDTGYLTDANENTSSSNKSIAQSIRCIKNFME